MPEVRRRKRRPSPSEVRRVQAEAGDVDALWHHLTQSDWAVIDGGDTFRQLLHALEVRARQDAAGLSSEMFARLMAFSYFVWFRGAFALRQTLSADQNNPSARPLPREVTEEHLPRLLEIQVHLAELAQAQASTARLWELTKRKKGEEGRGRPTASRAVSLGLIACDPDGTSLVIEQKVETIDMVKESSASTREPTPSLEEAGR
jgi:hypothetical protein